MGSEKGMPSSMMSAPAPGNALSSLSELASSGSPAVMKVTRPARPSRFSAAKRGSMRLMLAILADPGDKGPVELLTDGQGNEWLINRRNGFKYPVEDGIPIMLLEEGEKHKDDSLIAG